MAIPSIIPLRKNFKIWTGATFDYSFQWMIKQSGTVSPQDVTGFTGSMPILDVNTNAVLMTLTTGNGINFGGTLGTIELTIPSSTTATLTWTQAKYVLLVTDTSNKVWPLLTGRFSVQGL